MKNNKFILASKSPRRIELIEVLDIDFEVIPSKVEEIIKEGLTNEEAVVDIAFQKACEIDAIYPGKYVLGFDTLVILDGIPLGKPKDEDDAFRMLSLLSDRTHTVLTGCAIVKGEYKDSFYSAAKVTFNKMTANEITEYVKTKEPMDKAGAYGIQAYGAKFIKKVDGDYFTIVGLPIAKLYNKIKKL